MRSTIAALATFAVLASASGALADTKTLSVGDQSGEPYTATCQPGQAMVGYDYNSDNIMFAIGARCRTVSPEGALSGPVIPAQHFNGMPGGVGQEPVDCPDDMTLRGINVSLNKGLRVHHLRGQCYPLTSGKGGLLLKATVTTSDDSASGGTANCGPGSYVTGVFGTRGGGLLSMGALCHKIGEDDSALPSDDQTTADTGDTGGDAGGPDVEAPKVVIQIGPLTLKAGPFKTGQVMAANQPTTVYARPDGKKPIKFLDQGSKVFVVGCADQGQGWCRIVKPVDGFLWGGDLDH